MAWIPGTLDSNDKCLAQAAGSSPSGSGSHDSHCPRGFPCFHCRCSRAHSRCPVPAHGRLEPFPAHGHPPLSSPAVRDQLHGPARARESCGKSVPPATSDERGRGRGVEQRLLVRPAGMWLSFQLGTRAIMASTSPAHLPVTRCSTFSFETKPWRSRPPASRELGRPKMAPALVIS